MTTTPRPLLRARALATATAAAMLAMPTLLAAQTQGASLVSMTRLHNLESLLPLDLEDATPTETGRYEVHLPFRLQDERDRDNRFLFEPRVQLGFAQRWHASVGMPLIIGSSDRTNSGNIRGEVLFKPIDEGSLLPAIAFALAVDLPTGKDAEGLDTRWKAIATKTLGQRPGEHQVHGNIVWLDNDEPQPGERDDAFQFIVGYSTPFSARTLVVADLMRGHAREGRGMITLLEVGVRQTLSERTVLAVGLGTGDGDDAPKWRITAGLQTGF